VRRALLLAALAAVVAVCGVQPAPASAHPLGNFTINHESRVAISANRVTLGYTIDQAEIPTFQERGLARAVILAGKRAEAQRGLQLTVDGRRVAQARLTVGTRVVLPDA